MHARVDFWGQVKHCRHCRHYLGETTGGARCGHGGRLHIAALRGAGCAFYEREPGTDDDAPMAWPVVALRAAVTST